MKQEKGTFNAYSESDNCDCESLDPKDRTRAGRDQAADVRSQRSQYDSWDGGRTKGTPSSKVAKPRTRSRTIVKKVVKEEVDPATDVISLQIQLQEMKQNLVNSEALVAELDEALAQVREREKRADETNSKLVKENERLKAQLRRYQTVQPAPNTNMLKQRVKGSRPTPTKIIVDLPKQVSKLKTRRETK